MDLFPSSHEGHSAEARAAFNGGGHTTLPRIHLRRAPLDTPDITKRECTGGPSCEKPGGYVTNLAIILGIVIPVIVAGIVLVFLHRRNVRRLRMEDAKDPNVGLDFGLDDAPRKGGKRKSLVLGEDLAVHKPGQLSMDMNHSSPYLLPPGIQQSHDSIHSLARTFPNEQDPYRTIKGYTNSETGSIRSFADSKRNSLNTGRSMASPMYLPHRATSAPKSPVSPDYNTNPFATPTTPGPSNPLLSPVDANESIRPVQPIIPEIGTVSYPHGWIGGNGGDLPDIQPSPVALSRDALMTQPTSPAGPPSPGLAIGIAHAGNEDSLFPVPGTLAGFDLDLPQVASPTFEDAALVGSHALDTTPGLARSHDVPHGGQGEHPQTRTSQYSDEFVEGDERGRTMQRRVPINPQARQGFGVPQQESKRLSVGFRPLPPNEMTGSEDSEYRANRIRSFYKEYFDDSKEAPPPLPNQHMPPQHGEDYDDNYLGDAAYYDVETNSFVMPYAQPVTRRAMTPPPAGRSRGGPGGPGGPGGRGPRGPHGPHGSMGGMSMAGGPGRPRAGSAFSPRPGSSTSARMRGPAKRPLPPPSKLRDDSFAIMNAIDFAPLDSFAERAAGRSQSPLGERRPYQPMVPAASPLVTAFDKLSALPSPHLLRKSSTFTNLDFAPPKKFKDADSMSDTGSMRSDKSGLSAVQLGAIRGGAGRVSRLPGNMVFTAAAMSNQLKPQWGMRP